MYKGPTLIHTQEALAEMVDYLSQQPLFSLDTESDSLYSYYPKVCLIQISTYADPKNPDSLKVIDYLVDPLRLDNIALLGPLIADPKIEVILHAAENDILTMQKDFEFTFTNIYDTQLAARILGWDRVGLASILADRFQVVSNKAMQRANWGQRPLTSEQIAYAQMDTHYLLKLREEQIDELQLRHRWREAQEAFDGLSRLNFLDRPTPKRTFWQMKAGRSVPREDTNVLEALWQWREREAQRQDRPSFKLVSDQALSKMAVRQPRNWTELERTPAINNDQIRRYGRSLLQAVQEGKRRPLPDLPTSSRPPAWAIDGKTQSLYDALRHWRTQTANQRGVDPDIIFNNDTLMKIARQCPQSIEELYKANEIGEWKAKEYGLEIMKIVARYDI